MQAVECVFDQICSFGLYVIRYVMFLCFQVHLRTKQTKCILAYVMLNIICLYVYLEEPSGYPAPPGLTWRNLPGLPSTTRINAFLCQSSVFCTLIHMWRCQINYYSYVKKIEKLLIRICEFELSKSNTG